MYSTILCKANVGSTVIDSELEHFNNFSASWWTTYWMLETQNNLRVPEIVRSLVETGRISRAAANSSKPLEGLQILDVGCGGGFLSERLASLGAQVTALDPCGTLIECARQHIKHQADVRDQVKYIHGTVEEFAAHCADRYDHVAAAEILDHIQARELFVQSCAKVLKPGGTLFVSTINRTVRAWLRIVLYLEYIARAVPRGTHHWRLFVTPEETKTWIENAGCTVRAFGGWRLHSNGEWAPCDTCAMFYYMVAVKKCTY